MVVINKGFVNNPLINARVFLTKFLMKISIIITVAGNDIERYVNMIQLLKAIKSQTVPPHELIIVEQCLKNNDYYYDIVPMEINNTRYVSIKFQEHPDLFSVGWGRNVGIYRATGDVFVCLDVDYVFGSTYFETISNMEIKNSCVGWSKIYYVNPNEKRAFIQTGIFPTGDEKYMNIATKENGNMGGSQIFNREWFINNLVGYSEDIFRWGCDDSDVYYRSREITGEWHILDYTIYHLHHNYKQARLINNDIITDKNRNNPVVIAQLMRKMGVGNVDHPNPVYSDSIKEAEI